MPHTAREGRVRGERASWRGASGRVVPVRGRCLPGVVASASRRRRGTHGWARGGCLGLQGRRGARAGGETPRGAVATRRSEGARMEQSGQGNLVTPG